MAALFNKLNKLSDLPDYLLWPYIEVQQKIYYEKEQAALTRLTDLLGNLLADYREGILPVLMQVDIGPFRDSYNGEITREDFYPVV